MFWKFLRNNQTKSETFQKAALKNFRKFLEKYLWQSSCSTYLQTFRLANMLNTVFPQISAGPQIITSLRYVLNLTVWKFNKCQGYLLEEIRYELCHGCFSWNFLKICRTAMFKSNRIFMQWFQCSGFLCLK